MPRGLNEPAPSPRRRLLKQVFWFAVLHFVVLKVVEGIIFFAAHVPPKAVNLDGAISILVGVENVLKFPRLLAIKLWPWESTPGGLGMVLTIFNSAVWGAMLAGLRNFWRRATT